MSAMSDYLKDALIEHFFRGNEKPSPSTVYVALFTSNPGGGGSGNEVSGGGYSRQAVSFKALSGGESSNSNFIEFPIATSNWGTISHYGLYDSSSGGNLLAYSALDSAKTIEENDQFVVREGSLTLIPS